MKGLFRKFKWSDLTEEQFKALILLTSLKSGKDLKLRQHILARLATDGDNADFTFEKLVTDLQTLLSTQAEAKLYGVVKPDEEHVLWVYDGEFWRDELGFYRQVVRSACGR